MASSSEGDKYNIAAAANNTTATTTSTKVHKRSRRMFEIKKVEELDDRYVTFSKRKLSLINKVIEVSILCQANISLIIISPNNELHLCGYPTDPDHVVRHFLDEDNTNTPLVFDEIRQEQEIVLETLRLEHETLVDKLKEEKKNLQVMKEEAQKNSDSNCFPSWWKLPIDDMSLECVEQFKSSLQHLTLNLITNLEEKNIGSVPPPPPPVTAVADYSVLNECASYEQQEPPLQVKEFPLPPVTTNDTTCEETRSATYAAAATTSSIIIRLP